MMTWYADLEKLAVKETREVRHVLHNAWREMKLAGSTQHQDSNRWEISRGGKLVLLRKIGPSLAWGPD
jgi:hypothetical protein